MADDLVEVTLQGGLKVKLSAADAETYAAARTKDKAEREQLAKKSGEMQALLDAEAAAKTKAEEDAKLAKMTSKGEYDQALKLMQEKNDAWKKNHASKSLDRELLLKISSHPSLANIASPEVRQELIDVMMLKLKSSCSYDIEANTLRILGDGGTVALDSENKPLQADAWIAQSLDASSLLKTNATPGTGAVGGGKSAAQGGKAKFSGNDARSGKIPAELMASGNYEIVG